MGLVPALPVVLLSVHPAGHSAVLPAGPVQAGLAGSPDPPGVGIAVLLQLEVEDHLLLLHQLGSYLAGLQDCLGLKKTLHVTS